MPPHSISRLLPIKTTTMILRKFLTSEISPAGKYTNHFLMRAPEDIMQMEYFGSSG